jgi:hypothetical protein
MITEQTNEEKALHFASLGLMDYASFYATVTLIEEIKLLRKSLLEKE